MFITPSFKKSLIVAQFQGNYLKLVELYWDLYYTFVFLLFFPLPYMHSRQQKDFM